ncbi:hypothetical protein KM043_003718 [Ampulex compressa]|nr:hypothetical protein KM043_003718 [Ampulex compressa]
MISTKLRTSFQRAIRDLGEEDLEKLCSEASGAIFDRVPLSFNLRRNPFIRGALHIDHGWEFLQRLSFVLLGSEETSIPRRGRYKGASKANREIRAVDYSSARERARERRAERVGGRNSARGREVAAARERRTDREEEEERSREARLWGRERRTARRGKTVQGSWRRLRTSGKNEERCQKRTRSSRDERWMHCRYGDKQTEEERASPRDEIWQEDGSREEEMRRIERGRKTRLRSVLDAVTLERRISIVSVKEASYLFTLFPRSSSSGLPTERGGERRRGRSREGGRG